MRISLEHPSFISYLNEIVDNVIENVDIEKYFYINKEKQLNIQFIVFTLVEKNIRNKVTILSEQLTPFLLILVKKNEKKENYEVAAILNDIVNNFDEIMDKKDKLTKISSSKSLIEK